MLASEVLCGKILNQHFLIIFMDNMIKDTGFSFCPKCGKSSLESYLTNSFRCINCQFIYFHNTASAVGAIITTPDGILLVRRACEPFKGFLDTPGGFVDYGEQLETALSREISEELNIKISKFTYLASFPNIYLYEAVTYHTCDVFFTCYYDNKKKPVPNEEISEIIYIEDINSYTLDSIAFHSAKSALNLLKNTNS